MNTHKSCQRLYCNQAKWQNFAKSGHTELRKNIHNVDA